MSLNATAPIHHHADFLYANTDPTKLNWLEQRWMAWYLFFGDPVIATGLMSFILHEVSGVCHLQVFWKYWVCAV